MHQPVANSSTARGLFYHSVISHSYFHIPVCSHSIPIILHHFLLVKCRENHDIMTGRTPLIVPFRRKSTKRSRKRRRHLGLWVEPTEMGKTTNLALSPKVILDASYSQMGYIYITDIVGTVGSCYICYIVYD